MELKMGGEEMNIYRADIVLVLVVGRNPET